MPPQIVPKQNTGMLPQAAPANAPAPIVATTPQAPTSPVASTSSTNSTSGSVDKEALDLTHAIALKESGRDGKPDYSAIGDNGTSAGAYQWNNGKKKLAPGEIPANFKTDAIAAKLDPNDFSPMNQDKVEYATVVAKKAARWTPAMIAAAHNAGDSKAEDGSWVHNVGTVNINGKDIHYDTPTYVADVKKFYDQLSSGQNPESSTSNADSTSGDLPSQDQGQPEQTLGSELAGRVSDAGAALNSIIGGQAKTGQSRVSGILQGVGALAGAANDIFGKGLELIPGVKAIEGVIGSGVSRLAATPSGQAVVKALQDQAKAHPELAKDAGAAFNIVTAIPILKGLGAVKNIALDGAAKVLQGTAERVATRDLTETVARTAAGKTALKIAPDAVSTLVKERALPTIANGKYVTEDAFNRLGSEISSVEDNQLQPLLKSVSTSGVDTRQPIEALRKDALSGINSEFKATGQVSKAEAEVNRVFDDYKKSYGDYVTLEDVNDMKRGIRKSVNFNSPKLDSDVTYHIGQTFQKNIEDSAAKLGLSDVGAINKNMGDLIKAQKMLKFIEGKPIKTGSIGGMIKTGATIGGEALGNSTGIPFAGAYAGNKLGGIAEKRIGGITAGLLRRTGKDAVTTSAKEAVSKVGKAALTGVVQKTAKSQSD